MRLGVKGHETVKHFFALRSYPTGTGVKDHESEVFYSACCARYALASHYKFSHFLYKFTYKIHITTHSHSIYYNPF